MIHKEGLNGQMGVKGQKKGKKETFFHKGRPKKRNC